MAQPEIVKDIDARVKIPGDTMTGNLTAPTFIGSLEGNASSATKALQDGNGNIIASTYLPLSGGIMTGQIQKAGISSSWIGGRTTAMIRMNSISGYSPFASIKTTNGSWEIGSYDNSSYTDDLIFSYCTDANFNSGANSTTAQIKFLENGTIVGNLNGNATSATNTTNVNIADDTSSAIYVLGATTTGNTRIYRESSVYMSNSVLFGAAWNDYAEYRSSDPIEPGRVICETGNGTLKLSTERLQPGANVVSDTFGFAIGETENCKTPIAVSGRALVYTYEDRYSYAAGDPVCAGPGGTVSKMSREEVMMYPDRIVGTVSEIPEYEYWGTGNVKVKNRIWIKVK